MRSACNPHAISMQSAWLLRNSTSHGTITQHKTSHHQRSRSSRRPEYRNHPPRTSTHNPSHAPSPTTQHPTPTTNGHDQAEVQTTATVHHPPLSTPHHALSPTTHHPPPTVTIKPKSRLPQPSTTHHPPLPTTQYAHYHPPPNSHHQRSRSCSAPSG